MTNDQKSKIPELFWWMWALLLVPTFLAITFSLYLWHTLPAGGFESRKSVLIFFAIAGAVIVGSTVRLRRLLTYQTSLTLWGASVISIAIMSFEVGTAPLFGFQFPVEDIFLKIIITAGSLIVFVAFYPIVFPKTPFWELARRWVFPAILMAALAVSGAASVRGYATLIDLEEVNFEKLSRGLAVLAMGSALTILIFWRWGKYALKDVVWAFRLSAAFTTVVNAILLLNFKDNWFIRHPTGHLVAELVSLAGSIVVFQMTSTLLQKQNKVKPRTDFGGRK